MLFLNVTLEMPFNHGYAIFAGLERLVNYLENLTFTESDIAYLRELKNIQKIS